jgi:branched-chain amino acid transport system substrate-binding protein
VSAASGIARYRTSWRAPRVTTTQSIDREEVMLCHLRRIGARVSVSAFALLAAASAQAQQPLRIGVITFLSGPAAVPRRTRQECLRPARRGPQQEIVPGYQSKGFGGRPIELVYVDEAGGPTKVVTEYRNLVERQNVDMVIGVISSGDCLAVAPVAEELKQFTVLFDCATYRIFEEFADACSAPPP